MNYNQLSKEAHENAVQKGFWKDNKSVEHCLALVFTEITEAIEADRNDRQADLPKYIEYCKAEDINIPDREIYNMQCFETLIKDTVADELADTAIRLLDLSGALQINFDMLSPCRYYRAFGRFTFTENAYALIKGLSKDQITIQKRIVFALLYLKNWAEELGIDLSSHIKIKMQYNKSRDMMHGKKY